MKHRILMLTIVAALLLASCSSQAAKAEPDKVTVQLSWFHTVEFAGFYVADQKGYFKDENLAVTFVAGGPEVDPTAEVLAGRAQFGITGSDSIIRSRASGKELVAVSSIFRRSPLVVMTLPDSGIKKPEDLAGKKIGVISDKMDTTYDIQFLGMLKKLGVDSSGMQFLAIQDYHGANELTSGRVQAMSGLFSTNEPVQADLDGQKHELMLYADYGVELYANAIFASGQLVREKPDLVQRFVRATLKGYQYAIEHPDEAAQLSLKYDSSLDVKLQSATMAAQIPLIDTGGAPIGWMDNDVWKVTQDILVEQGIIPAPVDLSTLYTNQFVEKAK